MRVNDPFGLEKRNGVSCRQVEEYLYPYLLVVVAPKPFFTDLFSIEVL